MDVLAQSGSSTSNAELLAAVLLDPGPDAQAILAAAIHANVDPLDYCARSLGMGEALVMRRAAAWAGLPYADAVPATTRGSAALLRLDALADARAVHVSVDGVDTIYFAPGFAALPALRQRSVEALRRGLILTPRRAIRRALAEANSPALLVDSRQRLVRRWPHASASLDLSRTQRITFVAMLAAIVAFAAIAPLLARPLLLPFLLIVIVAPALLRLIAALHRPPEPQALADLPLADLPRYTILVPLRDEASMVPQLHDALTALDYPALCIKRTNDMPVCN